MLQAGSGGAKTRSPATMVDASVWRGMKMHFQSASKTQLAEMTVDGIPLFRYARQHFLEKRAIGQNLTSTWWSNLHSRISGAPAAIQKLKPEIALPLPRALDQAIAQVEGRSPASRGHKKRDNYLRGIRAPLLQHEVVAVYNALNMCYQRQCKFADKFGLSVARHIVRTHLDELFPQELIGIQPSLNMALKSYWTRMAADGWTAMNFVARHDKLLRLVLPGLDLDLCLQAEKTGRWAAAAEAVHGIVSSGEVGKALYASKWGQVRGDHFSEKVNGAMTAWEAMSPSAKLMALEPTREELCSLAAEAMADPLFAPNAVTEVTYLGTKLEIPTSDANTEVNFKLEAALRSHSVGFDGGVKPLPHEAWLLGHRHWGPGTCVRSRAGGELLGTRALPHEVQAVCTLSPVRHSHHGGHRSCSSDVHRHRSILYGGDHIHEALRRAGLHRPCSQDDLLRPAQ